MTAGKSEIRDPKCTLQRGFGDSALFRASDFGLRNLFVGFLIDKGCTSAHPSRS